MPACRIDGEPASSEAGHARAAEILTSAKYPLFLGLGGLTCEAQRLVISLADRRQGCVGATTEADSPFDAAVKSVGMVTATLGEVRHRADLIIFWGVDPATTHPRHFERYSLEPRGEFIPNGRRDRKCIVVGPTDTLTAAAADFRLETNLHGHVANENAIAMLKSSNEVSEHINKARYVALFFDPKAADETLLTLVRDMNHKTRFVCLPIGEPGNAAGAKQLLAWQTGRTGLVDFSTGAPRDAHGVLTTDAAVLIACSPAVDPIGDVSAATREHLVRIPRVAIHTADVAPPEGAAVSFVVATPGIHTGGTVFRCDGVPLPLRPAVEPPFPAAEAVLRAIERAVEKS